ncbi:MAG: putative zinc-binding metallopeptidase [Pseudomonadota bacterium]
MKLFRCHHCGQTLYFENWRCERCGHTLGYAHWLDEILLLDGDDWHLHNYRLCKNNKYAACNWVIAPDDQHDYCRACRHNRTVPDLGDAGNLARWQEFEMAKRRLFYSLLHLNLPLPTTAEDPSGLAFDFLADPTADDAPPVTTGHADGVITINILEADDAARESTRQSMGEAYRTVLGHFRHEVGHFYWQHLIRSDADHEACRVVFGDEREDYAEALQRHYENGPATNWQDGFVSAYATAHPWEDFAETWAHYLHITDTLETAYAFGISVDPQATADSTLEAAIDFNPYCQNSIEVLIERWLPLAFAVNSLNRSMGHADFYPFVLPPQAIKKLSFVHDLIRRQ